MTLAANTAAPSKKCKQMATKAFQDKMKSSFKDQGSEAPIYAKVFAL